jgi:hypothetical protein
MSERNAADVVTATFSERLPGGVDGPARRAESGKA